MFEHIRSIAIVAGLLAVAACGGGDSGSAGGAKCTNGTMSSPGIAGDPCTAAEADCTATGGTEMALCTNGVWGACQCVPGTASTSSGQSGVKMKGCGDGIVQMELGETCEMSAMPFTNCSQLMPGSTGFLNCVNCKYDISLCTMAPKANTGGSGAATGGTGAMSTGGTGARK